MFPKVFKGLQMFPNVSKCLQMFPNVSKSLQMLVSVAKWCTEIPGIPHLFHLLLMRLPRPLTLQLRRQVRRVHLVEHLAVLVPALGPGLPRPPPGTPPRPRRQPRPWARCGGSRPAPSGTGPRGRTRTCTRSARLDNIPWINRLTVLERPYQ